MLLERAEKAEERAEKEKERAEKEKAKILLVEAQTNLTIMEIRNKLDKALYEISSLTPRAIIGIVN